MNHPVPNGSHPSKNRQRCHLLTWGIYCHRADGSVWHDKPQNTGILEFAHDQNFRIWRQILPLPCHCTACTELVHPFISGKNLVFQGGLDKSGLKNPMVRDSYIDLGQTSDPDSKMNIESANLPSFLRQ